MAKGRLRIADLGSFWHPAEALRHEGTQARRGGGRMRERWWWVRLVVELARRGDGAKGRWSKGRWGVQQVGGGIRRKWWGGGALARERFLEVLQGDAFGCTGSAGGAVIRGEQKKMGRGTRSFGRAWADSNCGDGGAGC